MPKAEESKSVIENAILEYKQILEVAKNRVLEGHTKEIDAAFSKLINENLSLNNEPEMVKEESPSTETKVQESAPADKSEAIDMKEASLKEIEEAFDAASDDDEFKVVKQEEGQGHDFSLSEIEGEISQVMSEIEAAENAQGGEAGVLPEEEDNLTKIKKIHEEMGKMISAMDAEKNEVAMKENFHNKMMETFGEGYENSIGMNECGKMYETFKKKSMNETDASVKAPKPTAIAPTVKPVVAENEGVSAGKSNVAGTFSPNAAATSGTYAAKPVEKPLDKAVKEEKEISVDTAKVDETHGVGLSVNKLVSGTETPRVDHKEYAKNKVRLALQKESTDKLQKRINTLVNENFELTKAANKGKNTIKEMTKINESYREAIDKYRKQLNEMALVSTNIANVNNILVNESLALSFDEKKNMINEFKQVKTVEDSEKTYKKVLKEFTEGKKTIKESVETKINDAIESSSSEEVKKGVEGGTINEHVDKIKKLISYKHKN
jgi:hypothetical protein